jgi:hypothetical protein
VFQRQQVGRLGAAGLVVLRLFIALDVQPQRHAVVARHVQRRVLALADRPPHFDGRVLEHRPRVADAGAVQQVDVRWFDAEHVDRLAALSMRPPDKKHTQTGMSAPLSDRHADVYA